MKQSIRGLIALLILWPNGASGQSAEQSRKLQIAQSLESSGDIRGASIIYEDLWRSDSTNYVYFDALRRSYVLLKEHDKAIRLVVARIRMAPGEYFLMAGLGGLYIDAGRPHRADSVWNALISMQPKQKQLYTLIAQQMQERRLYGQAIDMYRRGRRSTGVQTDFVEELALLHSATQEYGEAVREYARYLRAAPHQLGYVQSRIASFTLRDEGLSQARRVVAELLREHPSDMPLRSLLAWVEMERGDYDAALPIYREIDTMSGARGNNLFGFAERAFRDRRYMQAGMAYREVAAMQPPSAQRPAALYGWARTIEERQHAIAPGDGGQGSALIGIPESPAATDSSLLLYDRVVKEYPGTGPAFQSQFRIGKLRYERQFDLDGALEAFRGVMGDRRAGSLTAEAMLAASDVLVSKADLQGAATVLSTVPSSAAPDFNDRILLQSARIAYLRGEFARAISILSSLITPPERDGANDALELMYHIQENAADSAALAMYAAAEVKVRQRKFPEAQQMFVRVSNDARSSVLSSRARLQTAECLLLLSDAPGAVALLDSVVRTMPSDVLRDRAFFRLGDITERVLNDHRKAVTIYESFLAAHPSSLFAEEVRKRLRALKGGAS